MSAPNEAGLELLRAVKAALSTREGRELARSIVGALQLAEVEAHAADPVAAEADRLLAKARRADRARGARRKAGAR